MALPVMPRWLAPVLAVVFVLLTAWAAYNAAQVAAAERSSGSGGPGLPYGGSGSYLYTAALEPNDLFNATSVTGTNITLFVPITEWVNVSFTEVLSTGGPASLSMTDQLTVTLSTPVWSKTTDRTVTQNTSASATALETGHRYDLNVTAVEAQVRTIDAQLNYTAPTFTVTLGVSASGSVAQGGEAIPVLLQPMLNLTFEGPLIVPKGAPAAVQGSLPGASGRADPPGAGAVALAYVELAAAAAGLGVSGWLLWLGRRSDGPAPLPSLERLIEPYEEVIARTTTVPEVSRMLPVERWEDLVKVADTLGRPILRPLPTAADAAGSAFYVVDGTVAYLYRYPREGGRLSPPGSAEPARRPGSDAPSTRPAGPPPSGGIPRTAATAPGAIAPTGRPPGAAGSVAPAVVPPAGRTPAPGATTAGPPGPRSPAPPPYPPQSRGTASAQGRSGGPPRPPRGASPFDSQLAAELRRIQTARIDAAQRWYAYSLYTQVSGALPSLPPEEARQTLEKFRRALDRLLAAPSSPG